MDNNSDSPANLAGPASQTQTNTPVEPETVGQIENMPPVKKKDPVVQLVANVLACIAMLGRVIELIYILMFLVFGFVDYGLMPKDLNFTPGQDEIKDTYATVFLLIMAILNLALRFIIPTIATIVFCFIKRYSSKFVKVAFAIILIGMFINIAAIALFAFLKLGGAN